MLKIVVAVLCFTHVVFGNTLTSTCTVNGTTANCSDSNLTHIPPLHDNITRLIFKNNALGNITNVTFSNVTFLKQIDITNNGIQYVSQDAFSSLTRLSSLILNKNHMPVDNLKNGFRSLNKQHVTYLGLSDIFRGDIDKDMFWNLNESGIYHIHLRMNNIHQVNLSVFYSLKHLRYLDLSRNFIFYFHPDPSVHLHTLILNYNKLDQFHEGSCTMLSLKQLNMKHNDVLFLSKDFFKCFPNIEMIDISENSVITISNNTFASLYKLTNITLDNMCGLTCIQTNAFNNSNVKYISLKNNHLHFMLLSKHMFKGCDKLTSLYLSGNNMMKITSEHLNELLKPVNRTLTYLNLANCILRIFPPILAKFSELTHLDFTGNELEVLHRHNFPPNLFWISFKDNDITSVNEYSLPLNLTNIVINLSQNQFDCTCQLLWFVDVFEATKPNNTFYQSNGIYTCSSPLQKAGINLTVFAGTIGIESCLLAASTSLIIFSALSFFVIFIIIGTVLYHYRWHFRYFLYILRNNKLHRTPEDGKFLFDAFVAYSDKDLEWILKEAIPCLEDNRGLQLCIHQRDFQLGGLIVDNIVHCVNSSRKFIILLSNNFARSQWCQFELALIQRQIRSQCQNILIVVKLDAIDQRFMSPSLFDLVKTATLIEWSDLPRAKDPFWIQLVHCIRQRPCQLRSRLNRYNRSLSENPCASRPVVQLPIRNRSRYTT